MRYLLFTFLLLSDNVHSIKPNSGLCMRRQNYSRDCSHQLTSNIDSCRAQIVREKTSCERWDFNSKYTSDDEDHYMTLKTYCYDYDYKLRALNITFNAVHWIGEARLEGCGRKPSEGTFRFTVLSNGHNACVKFVLNSTNLIDTKLFYDCIWYPENLDGLDISLEYQLKNENDVYISNGNYIMHLPPCAIHVYKNNVSNFHTMVYVNQDYLPKLALHIQKMPAIFNITEYRIKVCDVEHTNETSLGNDNQSCVVAKNLNTSVDDDELIVYLQVDGRSEAYFLVIEAKHEECYDQYCFLARTPLIQLNPSFMCLYIIVLIIVLIIFIAFLAAFLLQLKSKLFFKSRTKVLLLHDPVHTFHTNVVKNLASALKMYNIDVVLDVTDIQKSNIKNPVLWYSLTMSKVGHVVVVSTPRVQPDTDAMFKDLYAIGLRFVNEIIKNKSSNLSVINMLPPYCNADDISPELKHFKKFKLMKQFNPMVRYLQKHKMICLSDVVHDTNVELGDDFRKVMSELNRSIDEMKGVSLLNESKESFRVLKENVVNKAKYCEGEETRLLSSIYLNGLQRNNSNKKTDSGFFEFVNVNKLILSGQSEEAQLIQPNSVHSLDL